jgi:hypothetical protein
VAIAEHLDRRLEAAEAQAACRNRERAPEELVPEPGSREDAAARERGRQLRGRWRQETHRTRF